MEETTSVDLDANVRLLLCVDHPCIISNVEKAIATLGGQHSLNEALATTARTSTYRPLRLYLNPQNPLGKAVIATRENCAGLLLNVRIYRRKSRSQRTSADSSHQDLRCEIKALGISETAFRFKTPCDIQYLPIERVRDAENGDKYVNNIPNFIPNKWVNSDWMTSTPDDFAPVVLPATLLRFEPYTLRYRIDQSTTQQRDAGETEEAGEVDETGDPDSLQLQTPDLSRTSFWWDRRRLTYEMCTFASPTVPTEGNKRAMETALLHFPDPAGLKRAMDGANEILASRPIWRRDALERRVITALRLSRRVQAAVLLPTVTYLFTDGPFRLLLVKLGYDPRTDPRSKSFQGFFFSLRAIRRRAAFAGSSKGDSSINRGEQEDETEFIMRPDRVPTQNGTYQLCDVLFDNVQLLVHRNDGVETTCTAEHGWLLPDTMTRVRKFLRDHFIRMQRSDLSAARKSGASWHDQPGTSNSAAGGFGDGEDDDYEYGLVDDDPLMYEVENLQIPSEEASSEDEELTTKPKSIQKTRNMPSRRSKTAARSILKRISFKERNEREEDDEDMDADEPDEIEASSSDEDRPFHPETLGEDDDMD